jgi:hypothetical protein
MDILEYANSYFTFVMPDRSNVARIQLDARAVITDGRGGEREFFLITPCKSEQMYTGGRLFQDPNYDFCGIFSREQYAIIRSWAEHDPSRVMEWDTGLNKERFGEVRFNLRSARGVTPLRSAADVVGATLANRALYARTHIIDGTGRSAVLEYPVKTMNVVEPPKNRFQVDTGPLLFPTWADPRGQHRPVKLAIDQFALAFIVYEDFRGGEVVLRQPTAVGSAGTETYHYSRIVETPEATHELFAAEE